MTFARVELAEKPTFLYQGQRYLWGYSPDRQTCGLWDTADPTGPPDRTWPISEHQTAWEVFRTAEPLAVEYVETWGIEEVPEDEMVLDRATPSPLVSPEETALEPAEDSPHVDELVAAGKSAPGIRQLVLLGALAAVVVAGALYGVNRLRSKPQAADPSAAVLTAATTTRNLRTAYMSMTETVTVPGSAPVRVPASGEVDFTDGAASISMTVEGERASVVSLGGTYYLRVPGISQVLPGKTWLSVPTGSAGTAEGGALSGGNPAQMLQLLSTEGNLVSPLGPSTVDGVAVNGYSVLIDKAAVEAQMAHLGLSPAAVQAADQLLKGAGPISYKVYVDSSNDLRAMDFSMSVPSGTHTASVSASVTFSDFGAPVSVSAPPASDVGSLNNFLQAAGRTTSS